jgi:hypothetical protein
LAREAFKNESINGGRQTVDGSHEIPSTVSRPPLTDYRPIMRFWLFLLVLFLFVGCYEPKEGCLDLEATNYDVSADDPCPNCCKYPVLSLLFQHHIAPANQPDTSMTIFYNKKYQSVLDTNHYFYFDRGRFFISDLKLVREDGLEIGVQDSFWLPLLGGDSVYLEDNYSKHDREIFAAANLGTVRTDGQFTGVKFLLGLSPTVQQAWVDTLTAGHPLAAENDSLSYLDGVGYLPVHLSIRPDTLPGTLPIDFVFTEGKQISLDFEQPTSIDRGFNIKLTLRMNYMTLFRDIDFKNDSEAVMREKIDSQLSNAISVTSIKLE